MAQIDLSTFQTFTLWRTVMLGRHSTSEVYRAALAAANIRIDDHADLLLRSPCFPISAKVRTVPLAVISANDLGLGKSARYADFCLRGIAAGLRLCSPEVGPALRLAYDDQPDHESITLAMHELVIPSQAQSKTFTLANPVPAIVCSQGSVYIPPRNEPGAPRWLLCHGFRVWHRKLIFQLAP